MSQVTLSRSQESYFYTVEDRRDCRTTCNHRIRACFSHLAYGLTYLRRLCCSERPLREPALFSDTGRYDLDTLSWSDCQESDGLCLFLHGLNASSKQWETYTREFPKHFPNTHYLAGSVVKAGNCSLETAGEPFVEVVENYLEKFPGKDIILIGTSNGARLALHIEEKLNPELLKGSQLKVFSIAGVHGGTVLMDLAHKICCARALRHHPNIKRDLSFNSQTSIALVSALQKKQKVWGKHGVSVSHHFFAATEDEKVRPLSSSFPYLESTPLKNYQIIFAESHETIVDRVQKEIFALLREKRE